MKVPPGVQTENPGMVCKLQKSIYGLKQASRQWHNKLTAVLIQSGFSKSVADYSLFVKNFESSFTAILVYVDDLILTGNNINEINHMKQLLDSEFSIKDLGKLKFFLGMEIARSTQGIFLYQRKYALDLLQETGMLAAKPSSTPMEYSTKLIHSKCGDLLPNPNIFRSKKQKTVSRSSAEAEYREIALAACEAQWLVHLLQDLTVHHSEPVMLYCDNQSALYIAANPVFHERTKHIEIDCHSVRERIQSGLIHLLSIHTTFQIADIFTKSLSPQLFRNIRSKLGILDIHMPACGGLLESNNVLNTNQDANCNIEENEEESLRR
ncbi:PREDICTED: uncharacterized protein LOC109329291 [Lupinus angustifolius]|uniref:uncharacterized protein LOC109329291 n=1 Tax=Lupinus angustifolius TaxID=3871 RepID=UPI00092F0C75|nr:PREDICTED: uncharacterized protein LOC109329291 [Lupinus angustifolius]